MRRSSKNNKGITLVELLIYIGLSTIILVVLSELFMSVLDESIKNQSYSTVQHDGRYIMARLRYQVNNSDSISQPAALGVQDSELVATSAGRTYRFYAANNLFYLNDGTGDYLMSSLDSKITDVVFTRLGNSGGKDVIDISFRVTAGEPNTQLYESTLFRGAGGLR